MATGIFEPFNVKQDQENWQAKLKVNGILTNITYQSSVAVPGATTGWHSHPGPLFITVTAGAVTVYNAEDPTCTPRVFTAGQGFVEPETEHILRNEEPSRLDGRQPTFGRSTSPRGSMLLPRESVRSNSRSEGPACAAIAQSSFGCFR